MRRLSIVVLSLFVLAGCSRPKPSADYAEAQMAYDSITTRSGDDAYADPEMDRINGLLDKVPPTSVDAPAAAALKAKISSERNRIAEDAKKRQADLDVLRAPVPSLTARPEEPKPTEPVPTPSDPVAESEQPQVGLSMADFTKKFGACFGEGELITISNMNLKARSFSLNASEECGKKHGGFASKLVLFDGGKIIGLVSKDSVKQVVSGGDGGAPPPAPADAGR
jgi:hypothetical protein